jgi:hypothetical protein
MLNVSLKVESRVESIKTLKIFPFTFKLSTFNFLLMYSLW